MKTLPPHVTWPAFVIGLLVLGIMWSLGVVVASQSDGGAEVIDNYYEKAINWDQHASLRAESNRLGWEVQISLQYPQLEERPPLLALHITGKEGQAVTNLEGSVLAWRPQKSSPLAELPLLEDQRAPGVYMYPFPEFAPGLWDFEIRAEKDELLFYTTIRTEFAL